MADGGIMEAALMSAAIGGGASLATGQDPLKGALLGAISGGAMSGIGSALGAGADAALPATLADSAAPVVTGEIGSVVNPATGIANILSPSGQSMLNPALIGADMSQGISSIGQSVGNQAGSVQDVLGASAPAVGLEPTAQGGIRDMFGLKPDSLASKGLDWWDKQDTLTKAGVGGIGLMGANAYLNQPEYDKPEKYKSKLAGYNRDSFSPYDPQPTMPYYQAQYAEGGIAALAGSQNIGSNQGYPQSQQTNTQYASPSQAPLNTEVVSSGYEPQTNPYTGEPVGYAAGGMAYMGGGGQDYMGMGGQQNANGGNGIGDILARQQMGAVQPQNSHGAARFDPAVFRQAQMAQRQPQGSSHIYRPQYAEGGSVGGYDLGGYANGGNPRLLSGPGDGMSDSIPATIGHKQPARLAAGEFVIPADVVSHLGNGSTDAGAKHLYSMMDNIRKARTGNKRQGKQINADRYMPA